MSKYRHKVLLPMHSTDSDIVDDWCYANVGEYEVDWYCEFANDSPYNYDLIYEFLKHEDAVMFSLRWL